MSKIIERTIGIVAIILILLSLSGCSTATEGKIIEKKFISAHAETFLIPVITSTSTNFIPIVREYEDQWIIMFESVNKEGEKETRKVYTDEETYNSYEVGDIFVYVEGRDANEPKYIEEEI